MSLALLFSGLQLHPEDLKEKNDKTLEMQAECFSNETECNHSNFGQDVLVSSLRNPEKPDH